MTLRARIITSIVIGVILLVAAVLIWANQTGRISIWGEGDEWYQNIQISKVQDITQSPTLTTSKNFYLTEDISKVLINTSYSNGFDDYGWVDLNGTRILEDLSCHPDEWHPSYPVGTNVTSYVSKSEKNTLTLYAKDCLGGQVGGALTLALYKYKQTPAPTVSFKNRNITMNPNSSATLEWTSTNATSASISGPVNMEVPVNSSLSVSTAGTYTITVKNSAGTATDQATVTLASIPIIKSFTADSNIVDKNTSTTLRWTVENASSVSITKITGPLALSGSASTGPINEQTTFTLTATNSAGSTTAVVTIGIKDTSDTQAPSTPTNLTGTATNCSTETGSTINLSWTGSTDNNPGVITYEIYNTKNTTQPINETIATTWSINGAACNETYEYYVQARDVAGNHSGNSNIVSVTTSSGGGEGDKIAPSKPTNLTAEGISCSEIKLSWTASTDAVGVTGYDIYNQADSTNPITTTADTNYTFKSLSEKTTYGYFVKAHDAANNQSESSNSVSLTTPSCVGGQAGTGGTGGGNPLANITKLIATGQALWFNIIAALIMAGIISYFILRKR